MKYGRLIRTSLLTALALVLVAAAAAQAKPWSFAVICDQRSDYSKSKPGYQADGLSPYLGNIAAQLAKEKVDFVVIPGDMAVGKKKGDFGTPSLEDIKTRWMKWKAAMAPVLKKFPVYPARGNHDAALKDLDAETALWRKMFPLPQNAVSSGSPGQEGLSYLFMHKGALFVGLDEYVGWDKNGEKPTMDMDFLKSALSDKADHKFVFVHQPVWYGDAGESGPHVGATPEQFAQAMDQGGVSILFTGHVHTYLRVTKDGYGFEQIVAGNGGAPTEDVVPYNDPAVKIMANEGKKFGYTIVTVDGSKVTTKAKLLDDPKNPKTTLTVYDEATAPR